MHKDEFCYRIGIRRRFLPFYKNYSVVGHRNEQVGSSVRIVLRCQDGSVLAIPDIAKKRVKVYPEYDLAVENQKKVTPQWHTQEAVKNFTEEEVPLDATTTTPFNS